MSASLSWLVLVIAIPLTITPTLMVVRRSGSRRVPFLVGGARPPWWATTLSFVGIPLFFFGHAASPLTPTPGPTSSEP